MIKLNRCALMVMLLLCSACANKSNLAETQKTQQVAAVNWEAVTTATTMVRPSNSFLIMMR